MHRSMTLKQRITLGLAAFLLALAVQIFLSFYQSGTVMQRLDDQMGQFNAISRFQGGVERGLTVLGDYRWEYGDADTLLSGLDSAFSTTDAWLWRIDGSLETVSEEEYLLYSAVCTTYKSYTALVEQLEAAVRAGLHGNLGSRAAVRVEGDGVGDNRNVLVGRFHTYCTCRHCKGCGCAVCVCKGNAAAYNFPLIKYLAGRSRICSQGNGCTHCCLGDRSACTYCRFTVCNGDVVLYCFVCYNNGFVFVHRNI